MPGRGPAVLTVCYDEVLGREDLIRALRQAGVTAETDQRWRWHASGLLTICLGEALDPEVERRLEEQESVRAVVQRPAGRFLYEGNEAGSRTAVHLGRSVVLGGPDAKPVIIAGPCSVENRGQTLELAHAVRDAGAHALRGGAFKPRTSPYSFAGLGEEALTYLAEAREQTGLPVVTEALSPDDVDVVARYADMFQVGTRNMTNFPLLFQIGAHPSGTPVMLKRGFGSTVEELLLAAEYVLLGRLAAGHEAGGVVLCERGIRTFEPGTRFTLDVAAIPIIQERSHLPIIADPSHAAGDCRYVPALAAAALAAGADGLLVEVHSAPSQAYSDGVQSLTPENFTKLMHRLLRAC